MDMNLERACARMARANAAMRHDVFFCCSELGQLRMSRLAR